jgi:hypothetical protein
LSLGHILEFKSVQKKVRMNVMKVIANLVAVRGGGGGG